MIHHVTHVIKAAALPACISFYEMLGFREVEPPPGIEGRAVWLQSNAEGVSGRRQPGAPADAIPVAQQIHLMPRPDGHPGPGHFALICRDYDSTIERLEQAGADVDHRRRHWGSPRAYVHDPAGNLIELMAWPPGNG